MALTANITCLNGPCTSSWRVVCRATGGGNVAASDTNFTKPGVDASVSAGYGADFDINLTALANYTCSALLTVTNTRNLSGTGNATFQVRLALGRPPVGEGLQHSPAACAGPRCSHKVLFTCLQTLQPSGSAGGCGDGVGVPKAPYLDSSACIPHPGTHTMCVDLVTRGERCKHTRSAAVHP